MMAHSAQTTLFPLTFIDRPLHQVFFNFCPRQLSFSRPHSIIYIKYTYYKHPFRAHMQTKTNESDEMCVEYQKFEFSFLNVCKNIGK